MGSVVPPVPKLSCGYIQWLGDISSPLNFILYSAMWVCWLLPLLALSTGVESQGLGFGGLPGQRTPRTGSVWPPYPGAGLGYWARQSGFYSNRATQNYQPVLKQLQKTFETKMSTLDTNETDVNIDKNVTTINVP